MNNSTHTTSRRITRRIATAVFGVSALAAAGQVMADDQYSVAYSPEQMSSVAGMQALQNEIRSVASDACPSYTESRSFQVVAQCRADIRKELVAKINVPAFTAFVEQSQNDVPADLVASATAR